MSEHRIFRSSLVFSFLLGGAVSLSIYFLFHENSENSQGSLISGVNGDRSQGGSRKKDRASDKVASERDREKIGDPNQPNRLGSDQVEFHQDGSIRLPENLLNRLMLGFVRSDLTVDCKSMKMFGFTEDECLALESALREIQAASLSAEAKNARLMTSSDDEVIYDISGSDEHSSALEDLVDRSLGRVSNQERSNFLRKVLANTLSHITGDYGKQDRVIRFGSDSSGQEIFEVLGFGEGSKAALEANGRPDFEMYRRVAFYHRKYRADTLPERMRLLFVPSGSGEQLEEDPGD
jgi:hypothetical protein